MTTYDMAVRKRAVRQAIAERALTITEISEATGIHPSSVNRIVTKLDDAGEIETGARRTQGGRVRQYEYQIWRHE